jgi:signal transduction histidine kinase
VVVSVARVGNTQIMIEVSDDGPGIPDSEKAAVFEPFYRSDKARQNISGFGLGHAIALTVVHNHGGTMSLHDRKPHGLRARIRLPFAAKG